MLNRHPIKHKKEAPSFLSRDCKAKICKDSRNHGERGEHRCLVKSGRDLIRDGGKQVVSLLGDAEQSCAQG